MEPLQNSPNLSPLTVSAELCDGQVVGPTSVYVNLRHSAPFDYDIGSAYQPALAYTAPRDTRHRAGVATDRPR